MTDPIRAALDRLEEYDAADPYHDCRDILAAARAALDAAPEGEVMQRLLAAPIDARWYADLSHPTTPPTPAAGEVGKLVAWLLEEAVQAANSDASHSAGMLTWAAQVVGEHADLASDEPAVPEGREPASVAPEVSDEELDLLVIAIQALTLRQPDADSHDLAAVNRGREILRSALARWGNRFLYARKMVSPAPVLPDGYIDPEHQAADRAMLETYYRACLAEGGTADEITLRGLKAVLARWGTANSAQVSSSLAVVKAIREEILRLDSDGLNNDQINLVLSIIDNHLP